MIAAISLHSMNAIILKCIYMRDLATVNPTRALLSSSTKDPTHKFANGDGVSPIYPLELMQRGVRGNGLGSCWTSDDDYPL